jgi:hypothetical protein
VVDTSKAWRSNGVDFTENATLHVDTRGALTAHELGGVAFELVRSTAAPQGV